MTSSFTLNYGVRYEIDSQYNPLNTYYGDVGPRVSFAWDPFKDHKTVIRGGYGLFHRPSYPHTPQAKLKLGVLNPQPTTQGYASQNNQGTKPMNRLRRQFRAASPRRP